MVRRSLLTILVITFAAGFAMAQDTDVEAGGAVSAGETEVQAGGEAGTQGTEWGMQERDATEYATPTSRPGDVDDMLQEDAQQLEKMGADQEMVKRRKMHMGMKVTANDPQALLALQQDLNLTQDQVSELQQIADNAREEAKDVLTDQQRQQIQAMGDEPQSMMELCRHMQQQGITGQDLAPGSMPMGDAYGMPADETQQPGVITQPDATMQHDTTTQPGAATTQPGATQSQPWTTTPRDTQ